MIHQRQPNDRACLITAFAMVMGVPVETLIEDVGHDGRETPGHHPQELLDLCDRRRFTMRQYELVPRCSVEGNVKNLWTLERCNRRFQSLIAHNTCVMLGYGISRTRHAWAWCDGVVYDPALASAGLSVLDEYVAELLFLVRAVQA